MIDDKTNKSYATEITLYKILNFKKHFSVIFVCKLKSIVQQCVKQKRKKTTGFH